MKKELKIVWNALVFLSAMLLSYNVAFGEPTSIDLYAASIIVFLFGVQILIDKIILND